MESTKTDSLQHCQQYRLRLTLVHHLELPDRHCNLVSKKLHFSASSTPQRLSKPTPISGGWRLIPSFCQTSRILKL